MRSFSVSQDDVDGLFGVVGPLLDERQTRLVGAAVALMLGRGGRVGVVEASGMTFERVAAGVSQIESGEAGPSDRLRAPGAGRPLRVDQDGDLLVNLDDLVEPESRGDPMCALRWTSKSTYKLADALGEMGHEVSPELVRRLLHQMGYRLQAPAKEKEGRQHPDRDGQFRYLCSQVETHLGAGEPVISVDAKKKELVCGTQHNNGVEWQPGSKPVRVDVHSFPDPEIPKAVPYGVYDLAANAGWVAVGDDHDTAAFAANTISRWWDEVGSVAYPDATKLLITADAGGSNSYRNRLWKVELSRLAVRAGLDVTVAHFPPGTSKWNKIEHRLFSQVTANWRGRPLTSHQIIVDLIANTTTKTGLAVRAELDPEYYPLGVKISNAELASLPLKPHEWHGDWNYTLQTTSS